MSFRYILRYYIDPGFHEDTRIKELIKLCKDGCIEEVMLFQNPEELFQGYPTREELNHWFHLAQKVKKALDSAGIAMSINPWITTVHASRGRLFGKGQKSFQPMLGENGFISPITACPLDKQWQKQLYDFWGRIAAELNPTAIWIEDDWRLHNHGTEMGFGGCFCPLHMSRFSQIIGKSVSRETLLKKILAPGKPHPWRKLWLNLSRETLLEPAKKLYHAVHQANPNVRIGLMSSSPDVHAVEGREWDVLKEEISPNQPLLLRPHLPPYTEANAMFNPSSIARQTIACFSTSLEIYPELENSPRCGKYSKSGTYSIYECLEAAAFGANGITINHYDMMGNGIALDKEFPQYLRRAKPLLNTIANLHLSPQNTDGIKILFRNNEAEKIPCNNPKSMFGLVNQSELWARVFSLLGISYQFTQKISDNGIYAISDRTLATLTKTELLKLLSKMVILDAPSADFLIKKGLGELIGVTKGQWISQQKSGYAYEEIISGTTKKWGLTHPRMTASRCSERVLAMVLNSNVKLLSQLMHFNRLPLFPGSFIAHNKLGGIIYVIAYPIGESQFFPGFFNQFRSALFQHILATHFLSTDILCSKNFPLQCYLNQTPEHKILFFLNHSSDPCPKIHFTYSGLHSPEIEVLKSNGKWGKMILQEKGPNEWLLNHKIFPLGIAVLRQRQ